MEIDIEIKNQQSCADRDFQGRQRDRRIRSRARSAAFVEGEFSIKRYLKQILKLELE